MKKFLPLVMVCVLLLAGCDSSSSKDTVANNPSTSNDSQQVVKIGILPDVDSIPFIAAESKNYFKEAGIQVELVSFRNPVERDAALQSGTIDGEVADILAAAFAVQNGLKVKITSITTGKYDILSAPNLNLKDAKDLAGKKVAISKNTIIEYVADHLLERNGVDSNSLEKVIISQMPVRLQMLTSGKVDAACLPEPLASLAVKSGAKSLLTTQDTDLAPGIMLFTEKALKEKGEEIKKLYEVYAKVTSDINNNPDNLRDVLASASFPEEVIESFEFPTYDDVTVPTPEDITHVIDWLKSRELLKKDITYTELVDDRFSEM